jgi:GTP pyrophosphokinase
MIYAFTPKGDAIELPKGSTPIDFAYAVHTDIGNNMVGAEVNEEEVPIYYTLQNNDRVHIITGDLSDEKRAELMKYAHTTRAKRKMKSLIKE